MGVPPAGAASTLNCKMPVARVMWTFAVRFRVRDMVKVRVRCSFTVFSLWTACGQCGRRPPAGASPDSWR